jgi:NIPSNAP protein
MNRRQFLNSTAAAGLAASAAPAAPAKSAIYELLYFRLRNGSQVQRTADFLGKHFRAAFERGGAGPMGFFNAVIGEQSPFVLALITFPSLAAIDAAMDRLAADKDFQKAADEYSSMTELSYIRMENSLLRAFDGWPSPTPPKPPAQGAHIFELRTYESNNVKASRRKIKMFNDAEAAIFKRLGMQPVFFGETIVGRNLPNLTYMLTFDNLAAREKLWGDFGRDPEWQKLRAQPDLADALIVSNISNTILRPLPFSPIR